jgi:hypothetical protein
MKDMKIEERIKITQISKDFASGMGIEIKGSGWLVVDPLSAYLNMCGFENTIFKLEATANHPLILMIVFRGGCTLIPAGSDLPIEGFRDWQWINHGEIKEIKSPFENDPN